MRIHYDYERGLVMQTRFWKCVNENNESVEQNCVMNIVVMEIWIKR